MRFSSRTHIADVRCCARRMACHDMMDVRSQARTYGRCVQGNPIFTKRPIAPIFLVLELF
jgi:hypothetical protein